jgi:hypothetical protein
MFLYFDGDNRGGDCRKYIMVPYRKKIIRPSLLSGHFLASFWGLGCAKKFDEEESQMTDTGD